MHYWWVNQNKTFRQEFDGGYMWSPKTKSNGHINPFYEYMREVSPGDIILSFAGGHIAAAGVAISYAYECPQPLEFGAAGMNWSQIGWRVDVIYRALSIPVKPKDYIGELRPHLPSQYSPLHYSGAGLQGVYLTKLSLAFVNAVAKIVGHELKVIVDGAAVVDQQAPMIDSGTSSAVWEEHLRRSVEDNNELPETEKQAAILARRGQGKFKDNVRKIERHCRVTGVDRIEHLRASHCKPWRDSSHAERLDGENGLLLTPTVDHLFDRGFIGFEDRGELLVSPVAHVDSLRKMGIPVDTRINVGGFSEGQRRYLEYHRNEIFLEARVRR